MIIILMGVSGSGKTTVGKLLSAQLGWQEIDADDFHPPANIEKMRSGRPLNDDDRWPWLESLRELIRGHLARNENAVLACSALKERYREFLLIDERVKLIYLKGDHALIEQRLSHRREHFMNPQLLDSQFAALEEPEATAHIGISESPAKIVADIRNRLGL